MVKKINLFNLGVLLFFFSCAKDENESAAPAVIDVVANKQVTGSSANDLLSDRKFKSLVVEVVYVNGFEPSAAAINNFVAFISARTFKPAGINVVKRAIVSPGNTTYTTQQIVALEEANRTKYNSGTELAVWAFFADGKSSQDTAEGVVLGTAYRNTSFVIFEKTIQGLSDSPFEPNRTVLETTIITHEFGHILGLTNFGTALQSNHEDTAHPRHCIEKTCLMYWSAEVGSGINNMVSATAAPQLDSQCIADLRANGGR
ncbi:membrane metalloprotease [Flavobacterium sp. F339]|uniref:Membrane metalloprotease n=1 Tax=Flavobacterium turcicum TaxID=2764718 RepID=A0ABR7JIF3_9FLAO|nr:membrane metalloprotease [Flavobacterium turcicum]NHL02979.1 membrane metalloprotease [Flavobacterium turcicum]